MTTIGAITIGQAPRNDIVPALQDHLGGSVRFVQAGALDHITPEEITAIAAEPGEQGYQTRLKDGPPLPLLAHDRMVPYLQGALDRVLAEGAEVVAVLCAADWKELRSDTVLINAGPLLDGVVHQLARGRRLGVIRPRPNAPAEDVAREAAFAAHQIDAVTTVLNPYAPDTTVEDFARVGRELRDQGAEMVWMGCMGMDGAMRNAVRSTAGCTVLNAQGLLASVLQQAVEGLPISEPAGVS